MGSSSSSLDQIPNGRQLSQETGFSSAHLVRLRERFDFLDREKTGRLRPEDFVALKELSVNPVGDRIIAAFFSPGQETLDFPSFVRVLACFRPSEKKRMRGFSQPEPVNSRNSKLKLAFRLYDRDGDGKISRAELLQVLRAMLGAQVTEEQLESIVERAIREADLDQDDAISFDEFKKSLEKVNIEQKMSVRFLT